MLAVRLIPLDLMQGFRKAAVEKSMLQKNWTAAAIILVCWAAAGVALVVWLY
jgi:hypothetical protein